MSAPRTRISDLPDALLTAGGFAAIVQDTRTKKFLLGTAATKTIGGNAGQVPILAANGALSRADGGTGLSNDSPGANKVYGSDATGNPTYHDLPGGSISLLDGSVTTEKLALAAVDFQRLGPDAVRRIHIKDGEVIADKLAESSIDNSNKFAPGVVDNAALGQSIVGTGNLIANSVTNAVLANRSVRYDNLDAGTPLDGQVFTAIVTPGQPITLAWSNKGDLTLPDNSISTAKYINQSVTTDKIKPLNITRALLANNVIDLSKMEISGTPAAGKILKLTSATAMEYADDAGLANIPDGSLTTAKYQDGSVSAAKLSNNAVTSAAVADGAISTAAKLSNGIINPAHINATNAGTAGQSLTKNAQGGFTYVTVTGGGGGGGGTPADGSVGITQLAAGAALRGQVLLALNPNDLDFIDPANPPTFTDIASWGSVQGSGLTQVNALAGQVVINENNIRANMYTNFFAPLSDSLTTGRIWLFGSNQNNASSYTPSGSTSIRTAMFVASGDADTYYFLTYGNNGTAYFKRTSGGVTQLTATSSDLLDNAGLLPDNDRWYPMAASAIPTGINYALGKRTGTAYQIAYLIFNSDFSSLGVRYYTGTTTAVPVGFKPATASVGTASLNATGTLAASKFLVVDATDTTKISYADASVSPNTITPAMLKTS